MPSNALVSVGSVPPVAASAVGSKRASPGGLNAVSGAASGRAEAVFKGLFASGSAAAPDRSPSEEEAYVQRVLGAIATLDTLTSLDRYPSTADWLPKSPLLKPDWRLLRAKERVENGRRRSKRIDDAWVDLAVRYLSRVPTADEGRPMPESGSQSTRRKASRRKLTPRMCLVRDVLKVADDHVLRDRLEALLLTNAPIEVVAERSGLPLAVVTAFEAIVFCVRDRFASTAWLLFHGVGATFAGGGTSASTFRRGLAWHGGLIGFDVAEAALHAMGLSPRPPEGSPKIPRKAVDTARALFDVLSLPADTSSNAWSQLHMRLIGADREREAARRGIERPRPVRAGDGGLVAWLEDLKSALESAVVQKEARQWLGNVG